MPRVGNSFGNSLSTSRLKVRRLPLLAAAMASLIVAMWAGLLRIGINLPNGPASLPVAHGPLMVCGFLGTLISLERAVALGALWAYAAPALSALGAVLLILGVGGAAGPLLMVLGSLALVIDFAVIVRRQFEIFTVAMALGAVAWLVGNILWSLGWPIPDMVFWWAGFFVLTILGERMEMNRMRAPARFATPMFLVSAVLFIAGLVWSTLGAGSGLRVLGVGMFAFALWIALYDVARRTIRVPGLPRFIAVNLLLGAGWLAASGVMRMVYPADLSTLQYDAVLHSLFLGFVFSMIFAHAPIIFPAILGKPLPFRKIFYTHVFVLHAALLLRIGGDLADSYAMWKWGAVGTVTALLIFMVATIGVISDPETSRTTIAAPSHG